MFSQLDPDEDNREIFKNIFKVEHISYYIIDCELNNTMKYLNEIIDVETATQYQV